MNEYSKTYNLNDQIFIVLTMKQPLIPQNYVVIINYKAVALSQCQWILSGTERTCCRKIRDYILMLAWQYICSMYTVHTSIIISEVQTWPDVWPQFILLTIRNQTSIGDFYRASSNSFMVCPLPVSMPRDISSSSLWYIENHVSQSFPLLYAKAEFMKKGRQLVLTRYGW